MNDAQDSNEKALVKTRREAGTLMLLTGLWESTSKGGNRYLSGKVGRIKVLVFPNERRAKETDPDWLAYIKGS